jgi:hypothetical protein
MDQEQRVVVVDVDMKFGTMVVFLVKLAIAFIPAALILAAIGMVIALAFAALGGLANRV